MSSCNCMLSGREIATYTSTNHMVWMTIMQNDTHFTTLSLVNATLFFQVDMYRGPLCLL